MELVKGRIREEMKLWLPGKLACEEIEEKRMSKSW